MLRYKTAEDLLHDIVGISVQLDVSTGYDCGEAQCSIYAGEEPEDLGEHFITDAMTDEEKHKLADAMILRWALYKAAIGKGYKRDE